MPTLEDAIDVIRAGDREEGRQMLEEILETDESNEEIWLWLSSVVDSDEDREICLENVLALNPDNVVAQRGLEALQSGTFNVNEMMSEAIEEEEEDTFSESTFLDEFSLADETKEEEFELPSTMKSGKKAGKGGLNTRTILLVVVILCVVLGLGAAAVSNFLLGGEDGSEPVEQPPAQETPAEDGQPEATPTETSTPAPPTETPTPTNTPFEFELPTKEPTKPPTPISTPVVSPTSPS